MARLATAINNYQTNNNGKLPEAACTPTGDTVGELGAGCDFVKNYLNSATAASTDTNEFYDPSGGAYNLKIKKKETSDKAPTSFTKDVYVYTQAKCVGEEIGDSGNSRDYAIVMKMEGGGTYCKDSQ